MVECWVLSCSHNEQEGCKFFAFPKKPNELKKWITNLKRTDKPWPGARICSCHFSEGSPDNGPVIACEKVEVLDSVQLSPTENEEMSDSLQADPLELSNLLTDSQSDTEWTETPLNENDFETIFLSESEATNINNMRNQNISTMLRQTIESIQKENPHIETVFVDSESEGDCNETQTDLKILIDDDSATDDAVDDSATDDASETAEYDHNCIEFIDETDLKSLQPDEKNTNLLMDPLLIKPCYNKSGSLRGHPTPRPTHYTEKDIQRFNGKRVGFPKAVQPASASKTSNKSSIYGQNLSTVTGNITSNKPNCVTAATIINQEPTVKLNGSEQMEELPPLVPFSPTVDKSEKPKTNTNHTKFFARQIAPPPLLVQKIALEDASKLLASSNILELSLNSEPNSRKKYLVIPNNVLQIFKQMNDSVSINIPGIGAVCVRNPAELVEHKPLDSIEKPQKEQKPPKPVVREYNPLTDPKFRCWKYRHNVKRDLEGFSYYDRMGFYRAEVARAAACANKTKMLVGQLESSLKRKISEFNNFKKGIRRKVYDPQSIEIRDKFVMQRNKRNVKRIRDSIIKQRANTKGNKKEKLLREGPGNLQDHCYSMSMIERRKMLDQNGEPSATAESDLLITKKVVILKNEDRQPKRRKMSGTKTLESSTHSNKPVKRKPGRPTKYTDNIPGKRKPRRPKKLIEEIPHKPGRRNKIKQNLDDNKSEKPDEVKFNTCYVDLSHEPITKEYLDTLKEFYNNPEHLKIITTLRDFQSSVDVSKPILVVNKSQWTTINLEELSLTNNIVWPVSGTGELFPPWIGLTASTYNIKFVQPDILCKYLSGEREND